MKPIKFQYLSIAGMVRTEYDSSSSQDMALRTSLLFRVAKELKWLSDVHKICVVVINQVHFF
jgi:Rad51